MTKRLSTAFSIGLVAVASLSACSSPSEDVQLPQVPRVPQPGEFGPASHTYELAGPLVPRETSMSTAWDLPQNPLTDTALEARADGELILRGFRLFNDTPGETERFTPSHMSCSNCHLNSGQRELALPLVGAAGMFPEYNNRAGRMFSLEDRIVGCFFRSENAVRGPENGGLDGLRPVAASASDGTDDHEPMLPNAESEEVVALAAYIRYISEGYIPGENPSWRKQNRIPKENLLPVDELDPVKGESLFREHCINCHGEDGQGVQVGDKKPGPLWGPQSWNDGAGAARFYTLAGFIRYSMPYINPGALNDAESQHVAAYIISKPRPAYPFKDEDYQVEPQPVDAVFYPPKPEPVEGTAP